MNVAKVLHVIESMNPTMGGVCQAVRTIIKGLTHKGIHNEVVCMDDAQAPYLKNELFTIHALGPGIGAWAYSPTFSPWIMTNYFRFDVIIIHGLWLYHTYSTRKVMTLLNSKGYSKLPRTFVMPHGMLDPYFQHAKGRAFKAIRNWVYWKFIERKLISNVDGLLFATNEEMTLASKTFKPYSPKNVQVVGLGVEEPNTYDHRMKTAFLEKCPEIKDDSYILFLGRLDSKKGVDDLIKAYKQAKDVLCNSDNKKLNSVIVSKLVIAGPGVHSTYGKQIRRMIIELQLEPYVFLPGMLSQDAKWGAFYCADAFILPSHQENFGIAVVEALSCSKPVLISNKVNIWREVELKGGGIVDVDTVQGTKESLMKWYNTSKMDKEEMRKRAKSVYTQYFSIKHATNRMIESIK